MKKIVSVITAILLLFSFFACSPGGSQPESASERIRIVATIFPVYDWVTQVLGENPAGANVTMLLDSGVDLHSFQPSADDILRISTCDLFLYIGGESDAWVDDALKESMNPDMVVLNLLDILGDGAKEEEVVEGMQEGHEEEKDEESEYDEHVWLSLRNASVLVEHISEAIQRIDPDHADAYRKNAVSYTDKLHALDEAYRTAVDTGSYDTLLFGDRFPFRYLTDDYGLHYYAAFSGCSAETEASFETITFLSLKADELSLPAVIAIEGTNHRIAETIVQNTAAKDQKILTLDSMQAITAKDVQSGITYLSIMEKNLSVLKDALQ